MAQALRGSGPITASLLQKCKTQLNSQKKWAQTLQHSHSLLPTHHVEPRSWTQNDFASVDSIQEYPDTQINQQVPDRLLCSQGTRAWLNSAIFSPEFVTDAGKIISPSKLAGMTNSPNCQKVASLRNFFKRLMKSCSPQNYSVRENSAQRISAPQSWGSISSAGSCSSSEWEGQWNLCFLFPTL